MDVQAHIVVSGLVQGVGFRFFVSRLACGYGLTGWVKNLPAGQVEIEFEGQRGIIETALAELKTGHSYARVRDVHVDWHPYSGKYAGFDVRY